MTFSRETSVIYNYYEEKKKLRLTSRSLYV